MSKIAKWDDVDLENNIDEFALNLGQRRAAQRFGALPRWRNTLLALNDIGVSFADLADFIEEYC